MSNSIQTPQYGPWPVTYLQSQPQTYNSNLPVVSQQTYICATLSNAVCVDNKAKCKWTGTQDNGTCDIKNKNNI
jgi:hypothetical protein